MTAHCAGVLIKLGAWPPVSATGEKTGNSQRATHHIRDVRLINKIFTLLDLGGEEAVRFGGLECGGEESLEHFKDTLGWALERDAYVIDWETYTCIFPGRILGTDTDFWKLEHDAQWAFCKRMKESSPSSSGAPVVVELCAKPSMEEIEDRLCHALQPKPKSKEDARRDALFTTTNDWIKKQRPTSYEGLVYVHKPSGWSDVDISRAERFQAFYDRIIDLKWTVKPHKTDKKPVYISPENENKKEKRKEYRRMVDVIRYLNAHGS